ncbi:hypothetical protein T484DRAFT_1931316 [Baffinella frigidus]|nr:hypothetical protein T484DRAFT_1931316 [Cryptophyta sp. CCMP2293]
MYWPAVGSYGVSGLVFGGKYTHSRQLSPHSFSALGALPLAPSSVTPCATVPRTCHAGNSPSNPARRPALVHPRQMHRTTWVPRS